MHYFVVPAPGHYGDRTRVISGHRTLEAARRAARRAFAACVREGAKRKGDTFFRASEGVYPVVGG